MLNNCLDNTMYKLHIEINSLPKPLNKSLNAHYFKRHKINKEWDRIIAMHCYGMLPKAPLRKAHISLTRHSWRMLDYDGLVGSMKPVVDALVSCGVLSDDKWGVTGAWDVDQKFRPKKDGQLLEIRLTDLSP